MGASRFRARFSGLTVHGISGKDTRRVRNHLLALVVGVCAVSAGLGLPATVQAQPSGPTVTFSGSTTLQVTEPPPGQTTQVQVPVRLNLVPGFHISKAGECGTSSPAGQLITDLCDTFASAQVAIVRGGNASNLDVELSSTTVTFTGTTLQQTQFLTLTIKNDRALAGDKSLTLTLGTTALACDGGSCLGPTEQPLVLSPSPPTVVTLTITDLPRSIAKVSGDNQTGPPNSPAAQPLVVSVMEAGVGVPGATVNWSTTGGTLSQASTTTNGSGQAQVNLTLPASGSVTVTAALAEGSGSVTFTASVAPLSISKVSGDNQSGLINSALAPFVVLVSRNGAPASATVAWQITSGSGTLLATSSPTASNGQAQTILTLGATAGSVTVSATVEGAGSVTFTATAITGGVNIVSGNNQSGLINTALSPFVVSVTQNGTPLAGASVTWVITSSIGGTLSATSTRTGTNGQTQTTLTLGNTPGTATVTASLEGNGSVIFTATAILPARVVSVASGNNQTGVINATLPNAFVVAVTQNGAPAPGVVVSWTIVSGSGRLSAATTTTDGSGRAQNILTLGPTPGGVTVRAAVGDSSVTFVVNDATQVAAAGLKQFSVMGNVAITTATVQSTNIGLRLAALRQGGGGASLSGLSINIDGQPVPLSAVTSLIPSVGNGGGASADPSKMLGGGIGFFLNGQGSFGGQDTTSREPGFAFHTAGLTLGGDYRLTNNLALGAAFGYLHTKTELDDAGGTLKTNGYSVSAYGTYYVSDKFYLDGIATYGRNNYDTTRNITFSDTGATAKGKTDGDQFVLSVAGGYNFNFGPLTAGPTGRLNYIRVHIDDFQERGADIFNLKVESQKVESLATDLGAQATYAISMPWGVLLPLARFEWEHESKGGSRLITGSLVADPLHTSFAVPTNNPDRNYFNLGAGVTATLKRGASAFFYYETVLGRDNVTNHSFNAGIRYQFE